MKGLTTEELNSLDLLEKSATPRPWTAYPTELDNGATRIDGPEPVSASWWFQVASVGSRIAPRRDANAAFIPALRNAAPFLIAAAMENAKLRAVVEAARAYHAIASAPYDENRVEEFLELQANMGAALSALDAKGDA